MLFFLVATGAIFWGVTNILEKHYIKKEAGVEIMVIATMLGASAFSFLTQFVILGVPRISAGFWLPFLVSVFVVFGVRYWELKALKTEDVSIVAALIGLTPVFVIVTSLIILKEFPTIYGIMGILLAAFGIYFLNIKGAKSVGEPFLRLFSTQGAKLALLVAILGALGLTLGKVIVLNSSPFMLSATTFLAVALVMWLFLKARGMWHKTDKRFFWPLFGVGAIVGLSNVLMDSGFLYGIVPYVAVLKRTQIIWTMVFASIFLKERLTKWRLMGALIIIAGIVLITR